MTRTAKVVFSLTAHEKPEIIANQIANLSFFSPGALICLHLNSNSNISTHSVTDRLPMRIAQQVHFSDSSIPLEWAGGGLLYAHYLNYLRIKDMGVDYSYFTLNASNFLLCKHGLAEYLAKYDLGYNLRSSYSPQSDCWQPELSAEWGQSGYMGLEFRRDEQLQNFCIAKNVTACQGLHEGTFMSMDVTAMFFDLFSSFYELKRKRSYADEEVWIPSILAHLAQAYDLRKADSYVQFAWPATLQLLESFSDRYPDKFGIKQVMRYEDDPVRQALGMLYDS